MIKVDFPKSFLYNNVLPIVNVLNLYTSNLNNHMDMSTFIILIFLGFCEIDYLQRNESELFEWSFKNFPVLFQTYVFATSGSFLIMVSNTIKTGVNHNSYMMMACFLILISKFFILQDIKNKFNNDLK